MGSAVSTVHAMIESDNDQLIRREHFLWSYTIGAGSFSRVNSVNHIGIKIIVHPSLNLSPDVLLRFAATKQWMAMKSCDISEYRKHSTGLQLIANELLILSRIENDNIKHPNINRFHFAFRDTNSLYLAFDLKSCGDLRYHLRCKKTSFGEQGAAFICMCMADALTHLHARGIIHRDVKPENILIDQNGYPHLTDFGVSYLQIDTQQVGDVECCMSSGTPEYMAPEQLTHSHRHGVEVDFWSLGVVLFEILYRVRPFERRCPAAFTKLAKYFCKFNVLISSTGSRRSTHTVIKEHTTCGEYNFSSTAHEAYVKREISQKEELSSKLLELQLRAEREQIHFLEKCSDNASDHQTKLKRLSSDTPLELPLNLRVPITHPFDSNHNSTPVSEHCAEVVSGLLDPRRWRRLGPGANFSLLYNHPWFTSCGVSWSAVLLRACESPISFDKARFNFDITCQSMFENEKITTDLELPPFKPAPAGLTVAERGILSNFHYISPQYHICNKLQHVHRQEQCGVNKTTSERVLDKSRSNSVQDGADDSNSKNLKHMHSLTAISISIMSTSCASDLRTTPQ
jgi:serine/threonine protein kinase